MQEPLFPAWTNAVYWVAIGAEPADQPVKHPERRAREYDTRHVTDCTGRHR